MHVETIPFDQAKWAKDLLPTLTKFYFEFMKQKVLLFNTVIVTLCL